MNALRTFIRASLDSRIMKQQIDTSGLSFIEIRRKDKYYVDKSMLIGDILSSNDSGVYLFTRPRRFGKTTNLTMLDAFFNLEYRGNTWFDGLKISKHPEFDCYRNAFPVININLKKTKADTFSSFVNHMRSVLNNTFDRFRYLLKSDLVYDDEKDLFDRVLKRSIEEDFIIECVPTLCRMLERHHGVKPIILIDEYDRAVSDAFGSESHRPMMDLLGGFMCEALKNNDHLQMAYVTGVMQIAKESIFSDLNNVKVNNIFSKASDERFGFTESEVKQILSDFDHPEKFEEAKAWYDGYRFGNAEVYNPFSIMNYVSENFEPVAYWVNSGGDWIVRRMLECIDDDNYADIISLVTGCSAEAKLAPALSFDDVSSEDESLFSLMAMSGYLKAVPSGNDGYIVSMPNEEVRGMLDRIVKKITPISTKLFKQFAEAVLQGDADAMTDALQRILIGGDYLNLRENAYEMVLMTVMHTLSGRYEVRTEVKDGYGRIDILMRSKHPSFPNLIFELKCADSDEDLEKGAEDAMAQIHEKRYYLGMPGKVVLYGICFHSKTPRVIVETIDNGPDGLSFIKNRLQDATGLRFRNSMRNESAQTVPFRHELLQETYHVVMAGLGHPLPGRRVHEILQLQQLLMEMVDRCAPVGVVLGLSHPLSERFSGDVHGAAPAPSVREGPGYAYRAYGVQPVGVLDDAPFERVRDAGAVALERYLRYHGAYRILDAGEDAFGIHEAAGVGEAFGGEQLPVVGIVEQRGQTDEVLVPSLLCAYPPSQIVHAQAVVEVVPAALALEEAADEVLRTVECRLVHGTSSSAR